MASSIWLVRKCLFTLVSLQKEQLFCVALSGGVKYHTGSWVDNWKIRSVMSAFQNATRARTVPRHFSVPPHPSAALYLNISASTHQSVSFFFERFVAIFRPINRNSREGPSGSPVNSRAISKA